jgi:hypothetical protein
MPESLARGLDAESSLTGSALGTKGCALIFDGENGVEAVPVPRAGRKETEFSLSSCMLACLLWNFC